MSRPNRAGSGDRRRCRAIIDVETMLNRSRKTVLISYRRADTGAVAGHLAERLKGRFGQEQVFIDVDNIPFGVDFREHIRGVMHRCDIVLVLIGRQWAGAARDTTRIQDPADYFRIEIETAFTLGLRVIPVLVDRADMPTAAELPPSLEAFAFLNAAPLAVGRDFRTHSDRIVEAIQRFRPRASGERKGSAPLSAFSAAIKPYLLPAADWLFSALSIALVLWIYALLNAGATFPSLATNPWTISAIMMSIALTSSLFVNKRLRLSSSLGSLIVVNVVPSVLFIILTWPLVLKPESIMCMSAYFPNRLATLALLYHFSEARRVGSTFRPEAVESVS